MANADTPFGLRPVKHRNGAPYNGAVRPYFIPSTDANAMFIGDPVILTGTGNTARQEAPGVGGFNAGMLPVVTLATAGGGNYLLGPIISFAADPTGLENQYRLASTNRICWVADDPDLLFEIQEDSVGGALAVTDIGLNADLVSGSGSTISGLSGWELDSNTANTTATLQLRIERLMEREDNAIGNQAKWLVAINLHTLRNATGI